MKLTDHLLGLMICALAAFTCTWGTVTVTGFLPGQWQHDVIWVAGILIMTPIFYGTCMDVFGSYTKLTVEIIRDESMEETSSDS